MDTEPTNGPAARLVSYQDTLRAVGHWLDNQEADAFSLFETPTDITVVLEKPGPDPSEHHFTPAHLTEQLEAMRRRGQKATRGIPGFPDAGSYTDFFRALGFELDAAEVRSIILVKVGDQFLLTYSYADSRHGLSWLKRRITIDAAALAEIMDTSRGRRRAAPARRSFWRP